jgi:hypothetical protein
MSVSNFLKEILKVFYRINTVMRVAIITVVAFLVLSFADEHFNDARYTRAATSMLSNIARSFG